MRWLALFIASGCTCVPDPSGDFPCKSDDECAPGFHCIAGRCSKGSSVTDDGGDGCKKTDRIADSCDDLACAGQPCHFTSSTRGICCGTTCVDPAVGGNCGGCGNTCPGSLFCAIASSPPGDPDLVISGYCGGCTSTSQCPGTKTCYFGGCVCNQDSDCQTGQKCSSTPTISGSMMVGVCWYPP